MKLVTFLKRSFNGSISFRGRDFLYFVSGDRKKYRICIEHLVEEPNELLIYTETVVDIERKGEKIDSEKKNEVLTALFAELKGLDYKFIVDSSSPPAAYFSIEK